MDHVLARKEVHWAEAAEKQGYSDEAGRLQYTG